MTTLLDLPEAVAFQSTNIAVEPDQIEDAFGYGSAPGIAPFSLNNEAARQCRPVR
jgi:hypothetical protein